MWTAFSNYQQASGLHCLEGCGQCCKNPEVEASVLEMLPLALRFYDEGQLEVWLEKLGRAQNEACLLYVSHSPDGKLGRCGAYQERPSLCRMFGVAGYYNKHREVVLSVCKYIKEQYPQLTQERESAATPENTPMLVQWAYKLTQLDPALIQDRMPVNQALKKALEKVALYAQYQEP